MLSQEEWSAFGIHNFRTVTVSYASQIQILGDKKSHSITAVLQGEKFLKILYTIESCCTSNEVSFDCHFQSHYQMYTDPLMNS